MTEQHPHPRSREATEQEWTSLHRQGYFGRHSNYRPKPNHTQLLDHIYPHLDPTKRVLDFGCGYGRAMAHFLPRCKRITGVDVCPEVFAETRKHMSKSGWSGAQYDLILTDDFLGMKERAFDLAYSMNVFQHIPHGEYATLLLHTIGKVADECWIQFLIGDPEEIIWRPRWTRKTSSEPRHPRSREMVEEMATEAWGPDGWRIADCPYERGCGGTFVRSSADKAWGWLHKKPESNH